MRLSLENEVHGVAHGAVALCEGIEIPHWKHSLNISVSAEMVWDLFSKRIGLSNTFLEISCFLFTTQNETCIQILISNDK
jgi:hypothetical protein